MTEPTPGGRTLVLLRHAEAEDVTGGPDAERPLTVRGQADATAVGDWLVRQLWPPDLVICSPARRTRQTWHGVATGLVPVGATEAPPAPIVRYEPVVYGGRAPDLLALLRTAPTTATTILLVGHNPAVSQLSALLDPAHEITSVLPAAGLVVHSWSGDWSGLRPGTASVRRRRISRD